MTIKKKDNGSSVTIKPIGRLDTASAPDLDKEIGASIPGKTELVLDFSELDYISSSGLRSVLSAQKQMNRQGSMKVMNVNDLIMEILEMTGFSDILTIE